MAAIMLLISVQQADNSTETETETLSEREREREMQRERDVALYRVAFCSQCCCGNRIEINFSAI